MLVNDEYMRRSIFLTFFAILLSPPGFSQDSLQLDARDWLVRKGIWKARPEKNNFLFLLPVVGANPSAGFIYGAGLTYAYLSNDGEPRMSTISSNASYSTKKLMNLNVKSNLFVFGNRLFLNGDWRYFVISEITFGLASSTHSPGQSLRY